MRLQPGLWQSKKAVKCSINAYYRNCKPWCNGHLYYLLREALLGSKKSRDLWCLLLCPQLKGNSANPPPLLYSVTPLMLPLLPQACKFSLGMMEKGSLNSMLLLQTNASSSTWALGSMYLPKKWKTHGRAGGGTGPAFSCSPLKIKAQCQVCPWKHPQDRVQPLQPVEGLNPEEITPLM